MNIALSLIPIVAKSEWDSKLTHPSTSLLISKFTVLVGIVLSPWPAPLCGNFTVFPGGHHHLHKQVKSLGEVDGEKERERKGERAEWQSWVLFVLAVANVHANFQTNAQMCQYGFRISYALYLYIRI